MTALRSFLYAVAVVTVIGFSAPVSWAQAGGSHAPVEVRLSDGEVYELRAEPLRQRIGSLEFTGMAYNGSVPGPVLRVQVGSSVTVRFQNLLDEPTTVHWHGLRHDVRFDGVPGVSQEPVRPGGEFEYRLTFKDSGVFWYHPHVREDRQQDLGLYGMILVEDPARPAQVEREVVMVLNDLLTSRSRLVPHGRTDASHALMGRFGDLMVVNGRERLELEVNQGDRVRFHILNASSARPYNLAIGDGPMRVVGSDLGAFARAFSANTLLVGPAERYSVDVLFSEAGDLPIAHRSPQRTIEVGRVRVSPVVTPASRALDAPVAGASVPASVLASARGTPPDFEIEFDLAMGHMMHGATGGMMGTMGRTDQGTMGHGAMGHGAELSMAEFPQGIEWEDDMPMMNASSTSSSIRWILRDTGTGRENEDIGLSARVGELIKLRLVNRDDTAHPMHHPIHLHGQRFVVESVNGQLNDNPVWKDTVLVPAGATVDIVVEVTEPGQWMLHCHIPEHMEAGMLTFLRVDS